MSAAQPTHHQELLTLATGFAASGALFTALRLDVPELLPPSGRSTSELATDTGTDETALRRLLRALAALGVLDDLADDHYALSPRGALLRCDHPESARADVTTFDDPWTRKCWNDGQLDETTRTGQPAFTRVFGADFFAHLARDDDARHQFHVELARTTRDTAERLVARYDFSRYERIVDVGGGNGTLLAAVLNAFPTARGVLFDTAEALAEAEPVLRAARVDDRCTTRAGDFFTTVPAGGDAYLLSNVLTDWTDEQDLAVLGRCRDAVAPGGAVLLVEATIPGPDADPATRRYTTLSDLDLGLALPGRIRTLPELDHLLTRAGLRRTTAVALADPLNCHLVEAVPARRKEHP